jgi:hypothetical protein
MLREKIIFIAEMIRTVTTIADAKLQLWTRAPAASTENW